MQQNYQTTKLPTAASQIPGKNGATWQNPTYITADDGNSATLNFFMGGDFGASITGSSFGFSLPPDAVIDGLAVYVDGSQIGCYGSIILNLAGATAVDMGVLNGSYGGPTSLWGLEQITLADLATLTVTVSAGDVSGGDGYAAIDYMSVIVYWHIDLTTETADVPTRIAYKVYSRSGSYLGELPNVTSPLAFSQDKNSAGSTLSIVCGTSAENITTSDELQDETGADILDETGADIMAPDTNVVLASGNSDDEAIFKNSNRVKVWLYNYWYPNGKLMFSGQINRVSFQYGSGNASTQLNVISDGLDTSNFIARGYPFTYTTDVSQTTAASSKTIIQYPYGAAFIRYGQTFIVGAGVTNIGAITTRLNGTATVTMDVYNGPIGDLIGSITKNVSTSGWQDIEFVFSQLISATAGNTYMFTLSVATGQTIDVAYSTTSVYANGTAEEASYSGGSGGDNYYPIAGDLYFITKYGTPTTTTTYSSSDPVTGMARGILADYNTRGGYIKERNFVATGLSLTYTFNMVTIYEAIKKAVELSPSGYYSYIDLGTAEIDILPVSTTADYLITRGNGVDQLNLALSIENVKNYLLFTGGDVGGGVNLFRQYQDTESSANYGIRIATQSDNRVITAATANAIGNAYVDENSNETQETTVTLLNTSVDITQFIPGKTIGFRNFGNLIDDLILQIVRREINLTNGFVTLTLGRLPFRVNDELQKISRGLLDQQTIDNPANPS